MNEILVPTGRKNDERWRFWRDVMVFELKMFIGNMRDFALIPISLGAALIDLVSKGEREGPIKTEHASINPDYTVDAVIARIENVLVRECE